MTDTSDLQQLVGDEAMKDFARLTEAEQRAARAWAVALPELSEAELYNRARSAIPAAAAEDGQRMMGEGWFRADACMYEARRRYLAAGHARTCRGDTIYVIAYNDAVQQHGFGQPDPKPCTCGAGAGFTGSEGVMS